MAALVAILLLLAPAAPAPDGEQLAQLTEQRATQLALAHPKVAAWLDRYPPDPTTSARFRRESRTWLVKAWSGEAGQIAQAVIEDETGLVREAWTGPQVEWKIARGYEGAFGGRALLDPMVWAAFCVLFFLGLADVRKPFSLRNLDLLVTLGMSASLVYFNLGEIFASVALVYPVLGYLLVRGLWVGLRSRADPLRPIWPTWAFVAAAAFLLCFRIGLNIAEPHGVTDVGIAGVIGASRIIDGEAPYGNMPQSRGLDPCGLPDTDGKILEHIQTNGRCEPAIEHGDTYGPVSYLAYVPATLVFPWSGKWDSLPAAHATSIAFDLLAIAALVLVGLRFGGARLAALLAFAWTAFPFTAYALNANTNDTIMPVFLVLGFLALTSDGARGAAVALGGWAKFGALLLVPLWATYPTVASARLLRFAVAFVVASVAVFTVLLLEPDLWDAVRTVWERTIGYQVGRDTPLSLWGWGQYHAEGIPDLGFLQPVVSALAVGLALAVAVVPRVKGPIQLAALSAAVLIAFQLALSNWFYLYLPWFLPFVFFWLLLPQEDRQEMPMRTDSIEDALPVSESQSMSAPSIRTSP